MLQLYLHFLKLDSIFLSPNTSNMQITVPEINFRAGTWEHLKQKEIKGGLKRSTT